MNAVKIFNKFNKLPFGKTLFSKVICFIAPYFGSIKPRIDLIEPQRCVVFMKKRRRVTNHLNTVHAIAMSGRCYALKPHSWPF